MRATILAAMMAATLTLTGCSSLVSVNPIAGEGQASFDPALTGTWAEKDGNDTLVVRYTKGPSYAVRYISKDESIEFEALLFRAGEARILDLVPKGDRAFYLPLHFLVRAWVEGNTLRFGFLDSEWFKGQIGQQLLARQDLGKDTLLLTAPSAALWNGLAKLVADDRACGEPAEFIRAQ